MALEKNICALWNSYGIPIWQCPDRPGHANGLYQNSTEYVIAFAMYAYFMQNVNNRTKEIFLIST